MFPNPVEMAADLDLTTPRGDAPLPKAWPQGQEGARLPLQLPLLRGTHETQSLDRNVPVHAVAARCGHDPAVLLRNYTKRTRKADAAGVIGSISKLILGN